MAYDLIDAGQLAERQNYRVRLTPAERAAGDRTWKFGHVIVDEAQELSEMAWRMIMRRVPNRWVTVVGDVAQTGDPAGASSWQRILEPYVARRWKLAELTVNYRTPAEIMAVATAVLAEIDPEATIPRSVRESGNPPWAYRVPPSELAGRGGKAGGGRTRPRHHRGDRAAGTGRGQAGPADIGVGTRADGVHDVKGLEFDAVYLVEPTLRDATRRVAARDERDLYVALTRATQRRGVVHTRALPMRYSAGLAPR